jgi:hypothetical protein
VGRLLRVAVSRLRWGMLALLIAIVGRLLVVVLLILGLLRIAAAAGAVTVVSRHG